MFHINSIVNGKYGVKDTKDGVVEYYTAEELSNFTNNGIKIKGYFSPNCIAPVGFTKSNKMVYTGEKLSTPFYDKILVANSGIVDIVISELIYKHGISVSTKFIGQSFMVVLDSDNKVKVSYFVATDFYNDTVEGHLVSNRNLYNLTSYKVHFVDANNIRYHSTIPDYVLAEVVITSTNIKLKFITSITALSDAATRDELRTATVDLDTFFRNSGNYPCSQISVIDRDVILKTLKGVFKFNIDAYRSVYKIEMTKASKTAAVKGKIFGTDFSVVLQNGDVEKLVHKNGVFTIPQGASKLKQECIYVTKDCHEYSIFLPKSVKSCSTSALKKYSIDYCNQCIVNIDSDNTSIKVLSNFIRSWNVSSKLTIKLNTYSMNRHNMLLAYLEAFSTVHVASHYSKTLLFDAENFMGTGDTFGTYLSSLSLSELANLYRGIVKYLLNDYKFLSEQITFKSSSFSYRNKDITLGRRPMYDLRDYDILFEFTNWEKYETGVVLIDILNDRLSSEYSDDEYVVTAREDCHEHVELIRNSLLDLHRALTSPSIATNFRSIIFGTDNTIDVGTLGTLVRRNEWDRHYKIVNDKG